MPVSNRVHKPKNTTLFNMLISREMRKRIRIAAAEDDINSSQYVRNLLDKHVPKLPKRRR